MKKIFSVFLAGMFLATTVFGAGITKTEYSSTDAASTVLYGTADAGDTIVRVKTSADGTLQANITGSMSDVGIADATISGTWTTTASWVGDFPITGDMNVTGDFTTSGSIDWSGGNVTYVPLTGSIADYITAAKPNGTLQLGVGTYTLPSALTITTATPNLTIRGMGKDATVITGAVAGTMITCQTTIRFEDLTIQNTRANGDTAIAFDRTVAGVISNMVLRRVKVNVSTVHPSGNIEGLVKFLDCGGTIEDCEIEATSTGAEARAVDVTMASTAEAAATLNIYNSTITASGVVSTGLKPFVNNAPAGGVLTVNAYNSTISGVGASGNRYAVYSARTTGTTVNTNIYGGTLNGSTYDAIADASAGLTLYGCTLVNGTTSGTITYGGTVVSSKVHADGVVTETNFKKGMTIGALTIWISDGTPADGNLTGVEGDICLNGGTGAGQAAYCDSNGTNWTDM